MTVGNTQKGAPMEEMNQEFTAYLRRLLRDLEDVEKALKGQETERRWKW